MTDEVGCTIMDYGVEKIERVFAMISGKWKIQIIYSLGQHQKIRYGELKRALPAISHKILSAQLKDLEKDGLVSREEISELPLKVEYGLTDFGNSLLPLYEVLGNWCEENSEFLV